MSDLNAMTRIVGGKRVPSVVYDKNGDACTVHPVDGRELVASGDYSWEPPNGKVPETFSEAGLVLGEAVNVPIPTKAKAKAKRGAAHK